MPSSPPTPTATNSRVASISEAAWKSWHINPADQSVAVYTSPTRVTICEGQDICSAASAVPDFEMTAAEIFAK